jgi:metal-responsive CopG/Arc/MetJ family transcriptional regulator
VRIDMVRPEALVKEIDRATNNRSRFLADAAKQKLRDEPRSASHSV